MYSNSKILLENKNEYKINQDCVPVDNSNIWCQCLNLLHLESISHRYLFSTWDRERARMWQIENSKT
jgi:hypothetical protein